MRKYKESLIKNLQENSKFQKDNGVAFEIKPIPEIEKKKAWIQECWRQQNKKS